MRPDVGVRHARTPQRSTGPRHGQEPTGNDDPQGVHKCMISHAIARVTTIEREPVATLPSEQSRSFVTPKDVQPRPVVVQPSAVQDVVLQPADEHACQGTGGPHSWLVAFENPAGGTCPGTRAPRSHDAATDRCEQAASTCRTPRWNPSEEENWGPMALQKSAAELERNGCGPQ
jgi:hypothetical protein